MLRAAAKETPSSLIRRAKALVFDFDGTLVDSNPIKARAFATCFAAFPDRLEEILRYSGGSHHTPRWVKFRHVYEQILKLPYTNEVEAELHRTFADATTQPIIDAPEIPGASRFLTAAGRSHVTALLSSTPHEFLLQILSGRGWRERFADVQGAPVRKADWLTQFARRQGMQVDQVVFLGDTREDADAADGAGCGFIAVTSGTDQLAQGVRVSDFTALAQEMTGA